MGKNIRLEFCFNTTLFGWIAAYSDEQDKRSDLWYLWLTSDVFGELNTISDRWNVNLPKSNKREGQSGQRYTPAATEWGQ